MKKSEKIKISDIKNSFSNDEMRMIVGGNSIDTLCSERATCRNGCLYSALNGNVVIGSCINGNGGCECKKVKDFQWEDELNNGIT